MKSGLSGLTLLLLFVTIGYCNSLPTKDEQSDELEQTVNCFVAMSCGGEPVENVHSIKECCKEKKGITYFPTDPKGEYCIACPDEKDGLVQGTLANVKCFANSQCAGSYSSKSTSQCCSGGMTSYQKTGSTKCTKCSKYYENTVQDGIVKGTLANVKCYTNSQCAGSPSSKSLSQCCSGGMTSYQKAASTKCTKCSKYENTVQDGIVKGTLANVKCYTNSQCAGSPIPKSLSQCCSGGTTSYQKAGSTKCNKCSKYENTVQDGVVKGSLANVKCYTNSQCVGSPSSKSSSQCCSGGTASYQKMGSTKCTKCSKNFENAEVVHGALVDVKCYDNSQCLGSYSKLSTIKCCSSATKYYQTLFGSKCTKCPRKFEDAGVVRGALANVKCFTNLQCAGSYSSKSTSQCCSGGGTSYQKAGSKTCTKCSSLYDVQLNQRRL